MICSTEYLILLENVPISNREPEIPISGICIVSPCFAGFSINKKIPEIKLETTD